MSQITPRRQNGGPRYVEFGWAMSPGTGEAHWFLRGHDGGRPMGAAPKGAGEEARHRGLAASNAALGNRGGSAVAEAATVARRARQKRITRLLV
jgi:hypothetical protein